jgi:hypothetical protein
MTRLPALGVLKVVREATVTSEPSLPANNAQSYLFA